MRKTTIALLALCALAAAAGRAADPDPEPAGAEAELKKLKGTWAVTKVLAGRRMGRNVVMTELKRRGGMTFTFDGDKLVITQEAAAKGKGKVDATQSYKVKIDAKKKPHAIDLFEDGRGPVVAWIYKIEKGELYLARSPGPTRKDPKPPERPKDFEGEGVQLYVLTREKDKEKAKEKPKE
jgi:uncharacterized protein (TIGR03067 family)